MGNMLFEVAPLNNGAPVTLRLSSAFNTDGGGTQLNGYQWLPLIVQQPTREVTLSSDGVLDTVTFSHGSLTFWMSPDFGNEAWSAYEFTGASARAFAGNPGDPFSSYTQIFEGTVSSLSREGINASLELLGPEAALNVPLLPLEYAGTGGIEGPTSLKGKLKPRSIGNPQSVEPVLIDPAKWIYQVDAYGTALTIPKVYEFAQALDATKNKGDAASYAALAAMTLIPGEWATCNADGLFRLGATPKNKISADVAASGGTVGAAVRAMLLAAGVPTARIGDFSAWTQTFTAFLTEQVTVGDAVRDAMFQAGGYPVASGTGVWQAGDYFAAKAATSISTDGTLPLVMDVKELNAAAPVYKVKIGFDRCWGVHSDSDISPALSQISDATEANAEALAAAQEAADLAAADATEAQLRLDAIEADGILDRSEKADVIARFAKVTVERTKLLAQGTQYGITTERTAYSTSYNALNTYLTGLSPAYTDMTLDTPIVRTAFNTVWTNYYTARQNLLSAITARAAKLADWNLVDGAPTDLSGLDPAAGTKLDGVEDGADVTQNVLDNARFYLATKGNRIATENRLRFDPLFWTCNFPNTMISSVRKTAPDAVQLDAVFYERGHLAGLIWESADTLDHPTTGYDTNKDYRNCKLVCRIQLVGDVQSLNDANGPILTIEGRAANGSAQASYVRLGNCVTSGTSTDAVLTIDFNDLPGGFYGTDDVYAGDVDRMFISLVPGSFSEGSTARLATPVEARMVLSNIAVTGTNAKLVCGLGPGGVHELRMTNGYDDTYNVAPARIVRNCTLLGYKGEFNHYVGMSHYFKWAWDSGESRYIAQDTDTPLNEPCRLWHKDLAEQLHAAGMELILSLSYEMLNTFIPAAWRQLDSAGLPALTGWEPPSSLFSPCNTTGMAYLRKVARQFASIAATAGLTVHFQVGEPWYWVDFRTYTPYFYDPATKAKYTADTGLTAPTITTMTAAMSAAQIAYLDWLGEQLASSILAVLAAVRADHPDMRSYALLYLPQLLNSLTPETHRVNMPPSLAYPALDILQVEDYDFVIENRTNLSATGRARVEETLGYPRSAQHYFAGFALYKDTGSIWRYSTNAASAAYEWGVYPVFIWAYTQVMRDGYVPRIRTAPALTMGDIKEVNLKVQAGANDVLTYEPDGGVWKPGKPWLSDIADPADNTLLNLLDVPDSYIGFGLNFLRIKADGSGLEFVAVNQVPSGGTTGQVLQKFSAADGATAWSDLTAGITKFTPTGGLSSTDVQSALAELDSEKLAKSGGTITTNPLVLNGVKLQFSNVLDQKIELFNASYGLGVQNNNLYLRSNAGFQWFRQGSHSSVAGDPGAGGVVIAKLNTAGDFETTRHFDLHGDFTNTVVGSDASAVFNRANGAAGALTKTLAADILSYQRFFGYTGAAYVEAARITVSATSDGDAGGGGRILLNTRSNAGVLATALTLNQDKTALFAGAVSVPDDAYSPTAWDANLTVPTKNAVRDKIETIVTGKQDVLATPAAQIPALTSPWINYGGGFLGARYFKTAEGMVILEGLIQAPGGSSTSGVTLFTLLAGYRPTGTMMFTTWNGGGAGRIDIDAAGNVVMQTGNTAFTSLSGITFVAA